MIDSAEPEMSAPESCQDRRDCRVLVVDDNIDLARSLELLLSTVGHTVAVAYDGPSALKLAPEFRPQAVLLDIGLPDMDGYEVARRLRQLDLPPFTLVALTGYSQEHNRTKSRAAGFNRHLLKPVDLEDLQEVLAEAEP